MRTMLRTAAGGALAVALAANSAGAATITLTCTDRVGGKEAPFTLVYEGGADGILTVKTASDEMKLTARYVEQDADNWGINGFGPGNVIMPDKAAMEACLKDKAKPGDLDDVDVLTFLVAGCQSAVAAGAAPVAVRASVEVTSLDAAVNAFVARKYVDESPVAGKHIEVVSFPPPVCTKQ